MNDLKLRKPRRGVSLLRISLRTLVALVLAVGVLLGWLSHRAKVQREAVAALERVGGRAIYDFQHLDAKTKHAWEWPKWLIDSLGVDYLARVTTVELTPAQMRAQLTDADLAAVGQLEGLESLTFWGSPAATDAGMAHLRGLTRLKDLSIWEPKGMTGAGLAHLSGLTRLEELWFGLCSVNDADLAHLSGLVRLRRLDLFLDETSGVTDAGLAHLEPLRDLRVLQFTGARKITNAGLASLGKLSRLETLILTHTPISDLGGLGSLTSLQTLGLAETSIDDAGLAPIARLSGLRKLGLPAAITDAGLVHLRGLPSLAGVALSGPGITDAGMASLGECPNLEHICLVGTQVGDVGLAPLMRLKRLSRLEVNETRVTAEGAKAAFAAHPRMQIHGP